MATTTTLLTVEDIERMGSRGEDLELIRGVIREREPMGGRHGEVGMEVGTELNIHVRERALGRVYTSDTQFVLARNPDVIVKPDVSFVRSDRVLPKEDRDRIYPYAPDLAVEVVSPSDRYVQVMEKVELYLEAGTRLVWLVESRGSTVTVFAGSMSLRILTEEDDLDGGDVLPAFRLPVASIFRY
ncbi:MAG: Uma2 family endonuclease [Thermomicrobiales bacterium]